MIKYYKLLVAFLIFNCATTSAQHMPSLFFSKNTCSSYLRDRLLDILRTDARLSQYYFIAPSYCYQSASSIRFVAVLTTGHGDFTKLNPQGLCGSLAEVNDTVKKTHFVDSFELVEGTIALQGRNIVLNIGNILNESGNATADEVLNGNRLSILFNLDQLQLIADPTTSYPFNLTPIFTTNGLFLSGDNSVAQQNYPLTTIMLKEIQSTGITSFLSFVPLDFVNQQLQGKTFNYGNTPQTTLQFTNGKCFPNNPDLCFQFNVGGKVNNVQLNNTYKVTVTFSGDQFLIKSVYIVRASGNNLPESAIVTALINSVSRNYIGQFLPILSSKFPFKVQRNGISLNMKANTMYGHYLNSYMVLINSITTQ